MGYDTRYSLTILSNDNKYKAKDIVLYMYKKQREKNWFYPFTYKLKDLLADYMFEPDIHSNDTTFKIETSDEYTWYDHEDEMKKLSRQFPGTLFELHGEGEENDDIWNKYFKDGKMQKCYAKMVIPPYDEALLE